MAIIGVQLALQQLPHEDRPAGFEVEANDIGDQGLAEPGGQARGEVAHLVGVRKQAHATGRAGR